MNKEEFNQKFNPSEWESSCRKYDANHRGLHFHVKISFHDGKVKLELENLEPEYAKYQAPIKKLMQENMIGAVYYLNEMFHPWYASPEDMEQEEQKTREHLHANMEFFIRILFLSDFETFCDVVSQQTAYLSAQYELLHTRFENGHLIRNDGSVWNGTGWEKDGVTTHSFLTETLWGTLLEKKQVA